MRLLGRNAFGVGLVLLLGSVLLLFQSGNPPTGVEEGAVAPDFVLETLDGTTASLSDYRGKVVIVNFWASWCGPCRAEMPAFQKLYEDNQARGLVVLALNGTHHDSEDAARDFAHQFHLTFPVVLDRHGAVHDRYRLRALPSTFIVDRQGIIRRTFLGGPLTESALQAVLEPLLEQASTNVDAPTVDRKRM